METSLLLLSATAISVGFLHTILGPDHYLPFIVLSQSKQWSTRKTLVITLLCGLGHVGSSIVLGLIGIAVGISLNKLITIESLRGNIAGWLFIAFGLVYLSISIRNLYRKRIHTHRHYHLGGKSHVHEHSHNEQHVHVHEGDVISSTPWILFLIFIFGPCEPLIPLVMYPASRNNVHGVIIVSVLFAVVTLVTMTAVVMAFRLGLSRFNLKPVEKYNHVIAGAIILLSGIAIQFLGL